jgi:hypothetical protein
LAQERRVVVEVAHDDGEARRAALLARVSEGGLGEVPHRGVDVGARADQDRVLPAGLGEQVDVGTPLGEGQGGVERAREDHRVDPDVGHEQPPVLVVTRGHELQDVLGHAGGPELLDQVPGGRHGFGRWLQYHAVAGRQCGADTPGGDGVGEVPRWHDHDRPQRARAVEVTGAARVEAGEVDALADLGIGLDEGLAGVAGHHRDALDPLALHHRRGPVQHSRRGREGGPGDANGALDVRGTGDRVVVPGFVVRAGVAAELALDGLDLLGVDDEGDPGVARVANVVQRLGDLGPHQRRRRVDVRAVGEGERVRSRRGAVAK